jgi:hypothetical protein
LLSIRKRLKGYSSGQMLKEMMMKLKRNNLKQKLKLLKDKLSIIIKD